MPADRPLALAPAGDEADVPAHNLPAQPTPLIGREHDISALQERLRDPAIRLLTITGAPGSGKTRLAIAAAEAVCRGPFGGRDGFDTRPFPDGAVFVALEAVWSADQVLPAVARALDLREAGSRTHAEILAEHLRGRAMLLVLDNFEQVIDAAPHVAELLAACPRIVLLVTSRAPLRLRWEHEAPLAPLALVADAGAERIGPVEHSPAVRLFVERARAVRPDFALTAANADTVAAICARLDGLPLAIELAAARVKLLPPAAILERLRQRLAFLTHGPRDLPARHQTLRAAIAWSYELLVPAEQAFFRRLGVFAGGCTAEAVEAVAGEEGSGELEVLDRVAGLVDQSLVVRAETDDGEGGPRLRLLETLREYALERLEAAGELAETQLRHGAFFLALAELADPKLSGPDQAVWLERLEREHDNLRAALRWSIENGRGAFALQLAATLWRFWMTRGHLSEGRAWLDRALRTRERVPTLVRAKALEAAGRLAQLQGDYGASRRSLEESLALRRELGNERGLVASLGTLGNLALRQSDFAAAAAYYAEVIEIARRAAGAEHELGIALMNLGTVLRRQGDYATAGARYEEALALFRGLGDRGSIVQALNNLAALAMDQGQYEGVLELLEEGLALRRELGDAAGIARSIGTIGDLAFRRGERALARRQWQESLALFRQLDDRDAIGDMLHNLGTLALREGDLAEAAARLRESLALTQQLGNKRMIVATLESLADVLAARSQPLRAARLFGTADGLRDAIGLAVSAAVHTSRDRTVAGLRETLGDATFAAAFAAGGALPLEDAIAEALEPRDEGGGMRDEAVAPSLASSLIPPPSSLPKGLTAREVDVLRLLAAGRTSKQIAAELVVSVSTVERHIANIYTKTGAHSRADATAFAYRHGLAEGLGG